MRILIHINCRSDRNIADDNGGKNGAASTLLNNDINAPCAWKFANGAGDA